jgi:ferrous iron transport protein A
MDSCRTWHTEAICSLARLHKGARGVVSTVVEGHHPVSVGDMAGSTIERRLVELGFVEGERIEVVAEVRPGGDPMAVRLGSSIFALRRREAQSVLVQIEQE